MSLNQLFDSELPLNRKELYYTGTVFPMIVCQDDFRHFDRFTSLLEAYQPQPLRVSASDTNIQFFTEYNFFTSIKNTANQRFPNSPTSGDTPDILIYVAGERKVLIALEAKMFHTPSAHNLNEQMDGQGKILDYIRDKLDIDDIFHYALIPAALHQNMDGLAFPVLTWDSLYDAFKPVDPDNYFLGVLRYALDHYDSLVSLHTSGVNNEGDMLGLSIRKSFDDGTLEMKLMGRDGGLNGDNLTTDITTGQWKNRLYETSSVSTPPNRNWFFIKDFIERLETHQSDHTT